LAGTPLADALVVWFPLVAGTGCPAGREEDAAMRAKHLGRAVMVATAAMASFAACGDDDDDDPVEDIGDTIESVVDDVTDDSEAPGTTGG